MKKGQVLQVSFKGKDLSTNRVFDTTSEAEARQNGLYREGMHFGPLTTVLGTREILAGLEEELEKMGQGEQKTVVLEPQKAFGERKKELVTVVPLQEFKKRNISPFPGLIIEVNGGYGRVQTVSGGRVRVDLNSDLAGKKVEYTLKVEKIIEEPKDAAQVLAEKFFSTKDNMPSTKILGQELEVSLSGNMPKHVQAAKEVFAKIVTENIKEISKVKFIEEFETKSETTTEK